MLFINIKIFKDIFPCIDNINIMYKLLLCIRQLQLKNFFYLTLDVIFFFKPNPGIFVSLKKKPF